MSPGSRFAPPPQLADVGIRAQPALAQNFRLELANLLNRRNNTSFPGAQPVSFARKHLKELERRDYYVCEKSDGIRCLLYCTNDGPNEVHYLIDRKNDYYYVRNLHFPKPPEKDARGEDKPDHNWGDFHTDTLLDGELLVDTERNGTTTLKYLVFDCLFMDNKDLMQRPLDKRLAYFNENFHKPYEMLKQKFPEDCAGFPFTVEKKNFAFAYGTAELFKVTLPELKHGNDGLIFTCRETPYKFGTDENILKWKSAKDNTIDFKMEMTFPPWPEEDGDDNGWKFDYEALPTFALHVGKGGEEVERFDNMYVTTAEWEQMKQHAIQTKDGLDGAIVECNKDEQKRWRFYRFREDKKEPNHYTTVQKVQESIEDGVTEDELIAGYNTVRTNWKQRLAASGPT
jgi:mRNA guanylyltransferase